MTDPDANRGHYLKFIVHRADGSSGPGGKHENCSYMVLDCVHDRNAIPAVEAYMMAVSGDYPLLAKDLLPVLEDMRKRLDTCPACEGVGRVAGIKCNACDGSGKRP